MNKKRFTNVRKILEEKQVDALLISSIPNIIYLSGFSGFSKEEREGFLLITKNHNFVITDGRYRSAVKLGLKDFNFVEIEQGQSLTEIVSIIATKNKIARLAIEKDNITVFEFEILSKTFKKIKNFSLSSLREIKNEEEILLIQKACNLADKAFDYILGKIKKGVSEKELVSEIEFFIKRTADISFPTIVAFGENCALPHHQSTNKKLMKNQIVLLDFGVKIDNYCSDMTRTIFFGKATTEFKKMYQAVLEAQKQAIDFLIRNSNKDIKASSVDKIARDYIVSRGFPAIPHSLGHGIGLEVHENPKLSPNSKFELSLGNIFSIEPGIYIPNFGGVRIEDLVLLTKKGPLLLSNANREIIEV